MSSPVSVSYQQIIDHRAARKAAGLVGCISNRPGSEAPQIDFFGYRDVQIWNMDSHGRLNGDPDFDRMDPMCFCFDCRAAFDSDAHVDRHLIENGHPRALEVYAQLLIPAPPAASSTTDDRFPPPPPLLRTDGHGLSVDTTMPSVSSFTEIPMSLPAPRHRDIMNESPDERLQGDLRQLRSSLQSNLIVTMDSKRRAILMDDADVPAFITQVNNEEAHLHDLVHAIDLILAHLTR